MNRRTVRMSILLLMLAVVVVAYVKQSRTRALVYLGQGNEALGLTKTSEAIAAYQRALKADPKLLAAREALASVYSSQGQFDTATEVLRQGVGLDARNPAAHVALARCWLEQRRYPEAIESLKQAVELVPDDVQARLLLVHAYRWNGDFEPARKEIAVLEKLSPDSLAVRRARLAIEREERKANTRSAKPEGAAPQR